MAKHLERAFDFGLSKGKIFAFIFGFFVLFVPAFILFALFMSPVAVLTDAITATDVLGGAIGCGIGTGLVNAVAFSVYA